MSVIYVNLSQTSAWRTRLSWSHTINPALQCAQQRQTKHLTRKGRSFKCVLVKEICCANKLQVRLLHCPLPKECAVFTWNYEVKKKQKKKVVTEFPAEKKIDLLGKVTVLSKPSTCIIPRAVDCSKGLIAGILPVLLFVLFDCVS